MFWCVCIFKWCVVNQWAGVLVSPSAFFLNFFRPHCTAISATWCPPKTTSSSSSLSPPSSSSSSLFSSCHLSLVAPAQNHKSQCGRCLEQITANFNIKCEASHNNQLGAVHKWRHHFWGVSRPCHHVIFRLLPTPLCKRKWWEELIRDIWIFFQLSCSFYV